MIDLEQEDLVKLKSEFYITGYKEGLDQLDDFCKMISNDIDSKIVEMLQENTDLNEPPIGFKNAIEKAKDKIYTEGLEED